MEKNSITQQFSIGRMVSGFSTLLVGLRGPDTIWRIILSAVIGIAIAIGGLAVYASRWAMSEETLLVAPKKSEILSVEEMKALASFYEEKRGRFEELKHAPPPPPSFERGVGPVAPKTSTSEEEVETPRIDSGTTSAMGAPDETPTFTP